jgi:hypothetical protein
VAAGDKDLGLIEEFHGGESSRGPEKAKGGMVAHPSLPNV